MSTGETPAVLDRAFHADVARFHSAIHASWKHLLPCFGIGQRHAYSHQRPVAVRLERGFDVVVRRSSGQVHSLHVNDPAVRFQFQIFTCQMESAAVAVGPLVSYLPLGPRLADAYGHGPPVGAEQPFFGSILVPCFSLVFSRIFFFG